jgi:hypothetical protein
VPSQTLAVGFPVICTLPSLFIVCPPPNSIWDSDTLPQCGWWLSESQADPSLPPSPSRPLRPPAVGCCCSFLVACCSSGSGILVIPGQQLSMEGVLCPLGDI